MDHFEVIIFWSNEDQSFVADISELPGCMAHGSTHEEALACAAMALWLETAQATGRTVPQARGERLLFA